MALQPDFICWPDIEAGALEIALSDWRVSEIWLHLLTPDGRAAPRKVRAFADFLAERFAGDRAPWVGPCRARG